MSKLMNVVAIVLNIVCLPVALLADLFGLPLYPACWMPARKPTALRKIVALGALAIVLSACGGSCPEGTHYAESTNPNYKNGMCLSDTNNSFVTTPYDWTKDNTSSVPAGNDPIFNRTADTVNQYASDPVSNVSKGLDSATTSAPAVQEGAKVACSKLSHSDPNWVSGNCVRGQ